MDASFHFGSALAASRAHRGTPSPDAIAPKPAEPAAMGGRSVEVLDPPEEIQISLAPWKVTAYAVGQFFVRITVGLAAKIVLSITLAVQYFQMSKLRKGIAKAHADALISANQLVLQGLTGRKTIRTWIRSPEFLMDCQRAYYRERVAEARPTNDQLKQWKYQTEDLIERVEKIHKMVEKRAHFSEIRKELHMALTSDVYQALKHFEGIACIEYLQILCDKMYAANARNVIAEYGEACIGGIQGDEDFQHAHHQGFTWGRLAAILDEKVMSFWAFKRNNFVQNALWGASHLDATALSIQSERDPLKYNPHPHNPDLYAHDFHFAGKTIRFCYGPGPTGDSVYEHGVLPWRSKLVNKGVSVQELRINLQSHRVQGDKKTYPEHLRVCKMLKFSEENPKAVRMMSLAFNTKARKMGEDFLPKRDGDINLDSLFYQLAKHYLDPDRLEQRGLSDGNAFAEILREPDEEAFRQIRHDGQDNGWRISSRILDSEEITGAFFHTKELFKAYFDRYNFPNREYKDKKMIAGVALTTIEGMVSLKALISTFDQVPSRRQLEHFEKRANRSLDKDLLASRTFAHCKQDVDRAIVNNIILRLMFRTLSTSGPLSRNELHEIVGGVLGRARIVDGRTIQHKHYQHLSKFLKFFADRDRVRLLGDHLKNYVWGRQE